MPGKRVERGLAFGQAKPVVHPVFIGERNFQHGNTAGLLRARLFRPEPVKNGLMANASVGTASFIFGQPFWQRNVQRTWHVPVCGKLCPRVAGGATERAVRLTPTSSPGIDAVIGSPHAIPPRAATGHRLSTRPPRTPTYQS